VNHNFIYSGKRIMWIFSVMPDMMVHLILLGGIAGLGASFALGNLPFFRTYKLAAQIFGVLGISLGLFLEGALADTKEWELKVKELEVKVAQAEAKSAQVNTVIQERVVTKTQVVREKAQEVIKYIDRDVVKKEEVVKFVERCSLPQDVVDAHNKAVDELNKATEKKK
jgi:hypothetical protein